MNSDIKAIVDAINNLRQPADVIKDYIFPVSISFFSALIGWGIGNMSFHYQEYVRDERKKIDNINKWIISIVDARSNLLAIKYNYAGKLNSSPYQRASSVPPLLTFKAEYIDLDIVELSFLVKKKEAVNDKEERWESIVRIKYLKHNYNLLQDLWLERNSFIAPVKNQILEYCEKKGSPDLDSGELIGLIGVLNVSKMIELTERVIVMTDDLIEHCEDFLKEFPVLARKKVDNKIVKKYAPVFKPDERYPEEIKYLIDRSPVGNYSFVTDLFGMTEEDLNKRYSSIRL